MGASVKDGPVGPSLMVATLDLPSSKAPSVDYYYWHWASMALFQIDGPKGPSWKKWWPVARAVLLETQEEAGSWKAIDKWSLEAGQVYATAINALTLETPYRYTRMAK